MSQFIPLYDLDQFKDFVDLPLPTIIKAKAGYDYNEIDSNLKELIAEYPQIGLAVFDVYEQNDISKQLSITDAPAFLLYESGEIRHSISGDIPGQVHTFIDKTEESLH